MSTFLTDKEEANYLALRQQFECLQIHVVAERNAIILLRNEVNKTQGRAQIERLREASIRFAKDEAKLKQLHILLDRDEQ